ncbi:MULTISPECIES: class I SAM-dependent methyltransferase [unclassified Agarivorans]|uniref:class I SAM-dependent methyltransferase n=1 Tax=unclassified Agarivorans TaxID=2636026 RepID=UPI0026E28599|nr:MULTISPECIES: class I SAM-dependent methyltransferase [unclassified Agarivorans]MDO6684486.1 class I SAM-dependent methyltransferase [Agarivorans sp. 3_MG-2023]MDO6714651.1 class I SAM-dependent methyltransferase [Agarivorans sp. 2_MG-2023]
MDYLALNKAAWDKRTALHVDSEFYDVPSFIAGKSSLKSIELDLMGDVSDKKLLHLQCHFGLDSLSWARLGAQVTAVDLSSEAIKRAEELAAKTGLDAAFICDDVYHYGEATQPIHDWVFVSYGALCWLPDINRWAQVVADSLKAGGKLCLAEFHPVHDLMSGYGYFHREEADIDEEGTYTENDDGETSQMLNWGHPLSDVVNALIKAGLVIEQLKEYDYSPYNCFEGLKERQSGEFIYEHEHYESPLVYSIVASKR